LKKVVVNLISESNHIDESNQSNSRIIRQYYEDINEFDEAREQRSSDLDMIDSKMKPDNPIQESEIVEESLSLQKKEIDLIKRALEKYKGKRKMAAKELGISERTLYRKIKEYKINL
jgi:transcriptional regulator with PAS, ATPase and Fis domain